MAFTYESRINSNSVRMRILFGWFWRIRTLIVFDGLICLFNASMLVLLQRSFLYLSHATIPIIWYAFFLSCDIRNGTIGIVDVLRLNVVTNADNASNIWIKKKTTLYFFIIRYIIVNVSQMTILVIVLKPRKHMQICAKTLNTTITALMDMDEYCF